MAGLFSFLTRAYAPRFRNYLEEQQKMKDDLVKEMEAPAYASTKDTPYDRAQGFATGLLAMRDFPEFSAANANLFGSAFEDAQGMAYGNWEDVARDKANNLAAYKWYEEQRKRDPNFTMSEEDMKWLGQLYSKGLLDVSL
jgi:hypothetical protein